jgi:hypothetical protein
VRSPEKIGEMICGTVRSTRRFSSYDGKDLKREEKPRRVLHEGSDRAREKKLSRCPHPYGWDYPGKY